MGIRTNKYVAVRRRTDKNPFPHFGRCREYGTVDQILLHRFIKENIFAAARMNLEGVIAGHLADFISMNSCRVDDILRFNRTFVRFDCFDSAVFYDKARYLTFTDNFCPIDNGIFSKCQGHAKRPANPGSRCPQCAFDVFADIRFKFAYFSAVPNFQPRNAIVLAAF